MAVPSSILHNMEFTCLKELHNLFLEPGKGVDKGLTMAQFHGALLATAGRAMSEIDITNLFKKMDASCSGKVTWTDYITHIAQTSQLENYMEEAHVKMLFGSQVKIIPSKHRSPICKICFVPRMDLVSTKIDYKKGRYLIISRDGLLSLWTLSLRLLNYHFIGCVESPKSMYFVDCVVMYPSNLIAVTANQRSIIIYDLTGEGLKLRYQIIMLANNITCMDYWADLHSRSFSLLIWGDMNGDIHALELNLKRSGGLFGWDENRELITRVKYKDLLRNKISGVKLHRTARVHGDWVSQVSYIPEHRSFLSSSNCPQNSLCMADWFGKREPRIYASVKSVLCFDYCYVRQIIVTGSLDCKVRVWNFFMKTGPVGTIRDHLGPVVMVIIHSPGQRIISCDVFKTINVFDLIHYTLIQRFSAQALSEMGFIPPSAFYLNVTTGQFLAATSIIAEIGKKKKEMDRAELCSHEYPVVCARYSKAFAQIVSVCKGGFVSVWDVNTGHELMRFTHYSSRTKVCDKAYDPESKTLEITSLALDVTGRRAVTGAVDGTVNLWNFSTGVLLQHYTLPEKGVVSCLLVDEDWIYAAGWQQIIFVLDLYADSPDKPLRQFFRVHKEEILALAFVQPGLLASASYDGNIIITSTDTGHALMRMNPCENRMPVKIIKLTTNEASLEIVDTSIEDTDIGEDRRNYFKEDFLFPYLRISDSRVLVPTRTGYRILKRPLLADLGTSHSEEAFDCFQNEVISRAENDRMFEKYESSVECLIGLHTRQTMDPETATLMTAGAEGWIRAWSIHSKGGLRGQFCGTLDLGEFIHVMTTDEKNEYLITGDSNGYVRIWDILPYCNGAFKLFTKEEIQQRDDRLKKDFVYFRSPLIRDKVGEGFQDSPTNHKRRPPLASQPDVTLRTPRLLNTFRAHTFSITSIQYVPEREIIITGSKDCTVRIWLLEGFFIGTCGVPWSGGIINRTQQFVQLRQLPKELRRLVSARSLKVINKGRMPRWERFMQLMKEFQAREKETQAKMKEKEEQEKVHVVSSDTIEEPENLCDEVKEEKPTWKDPKKSDVLGKFFKPSMHHRQTQMEFRKINLSEEFGHCPAFRQLPIHDLTPMPQEEIPNIMIDIEARRRSAEEEECIYYTRKRTAHRYPNGKSLKKCIPSTHRDINISSNYSDANSSRQPLTTSSSRSSTITSGYLLPRLSGHSLDKLTLSSRTSLLVPGWHKKRI